MLLLPRYPVTRIARPFSGGVSTAFNRREIAEKLTINNSTVVAYAAGDEIDDRDVLIHHARHLVAAGHTTSHEKTRAGKLDPERGRHRAFYRRSWIG